MLVAVQICDLRPAVHSRIKFEAGRSGGLDDDCGGGRSERDGGGGRQRGTFSIFAKTNSTLPRHIPHLFFICPSSVLSVCQLLFFVPFTTQLQLVHRPNKLHPFQFPIHPRSKFHITIQFLQLRIHTSQGFTQEAQYLFYNYILRLQQNPMPYIINANLLHSLNKLMTLLHVLRRTCSISSPPQEQNRKCGRDIGWKFTVYRRCSGILPGKITVILAILPRSSSNRTLAVRQYDNGPSIPPSENWFK